MDEYLFIALAKLRADEARLRRESQRQAESRAAVEERRYPNHTSRARWFNANSELA